MVELVLASASPRRAELLRQIGIKFRVDPADIDESINAEEQPIDLVERLAGQKASCKIASDRLVLAADTIVFDDVSILGKPRDRTDAIEMLARLSNRIHQVVTAICVANDDSMICQVVTTSVTLRPISEAEAIAYWDSGEPRDKAGGFAIQGLGAVFVKNIQGSYSNVVGLPLFETAALLGRYGIQALRVRH